MDRLTEAGDGGHGVLDPCGAGAAREAPGTLWPEASESFVLSPQVEALVDRAVTYLEAGYPVHFCGPPGTGKTTLAFHVASRIARPVTLIHGDDEFGSSDLIGGDVGYKRSRLVDNFIHSVLKTEETASRTWVDNRLTTACRRGDTLIYDEFTRSRPEANNVLLSILAERLLNLPKARGDGGGYLDVHPEFRAILTSNPEEYAGVHRTQDALMDRVVTIRLDAFDRDTEVEIVVARSGIGREDAATIVDLVRAQRAGTRRRRRQPPSVRAAIAIARVLARRGALARPSDALYRAVCLDLLDVRVGARRGKP